MGQLLICLALALALFFFFSWLGHAAYGILVSQPGIEPRPSAVRTQSPNRWTTREVPDFAYLLTHPLLFSPKLSDTTVRSPLMWLDTAGGLSPSFLWRERPSWVVSSLVFWAGRCCSHCRLGTSLHIVLRVLSLAELLFFWSQPVCPLGLCWFALDLVVHIFCAREKECIGGKMVLRFCVFEKTKAFFTFILNWEFGLGRILDWK